MEPNQTSKNRGWPTVVRVLLCVVLSVAVLIALYVAFCAEENWRARRDLSRYEAELKAAGEKLDIASLISPPVPDAENFAMAPLFAPIINATQKQVDEKRQNYDPALARLEKVDLTRTGNLKPSLALGDYETGRPTDFIAWLHDQQSDPKQNSITERNEAGRAVLQSLMQFSSELEEFAAAANRPHARFPLDYSKGFAMPVHHLTVFLRFSIVYSRRAQATLAAGDSEMALRDLGTLDRMQAALRDEPILISHLVRIAIMRSLLQVVWQGNIDHRWNAAQLQQIETILDRPDLLADYAHAIRGERAIMHATYAQFRSQRRSVASIDADYSHLLEMAGESWPKWWTLLEMLCPAEAVLNRNQAWGERWTQDYVLTVVDPQNHHVYPNKQKDADDHLHETKTSLYNLFAKLTALPTSSAVVRAASTQIAIDEARIATAIERFRLRRSQIPENLNELVPEYLPAIPNDIVDGKMLRYRREGTANYLLYSIGWNQTDDGGTISRKEKGKGRDSGKGDWVWFGSAQNVNPSGL